MKLDVALKEWAIVCDFLAQGRCALLLRKGGIHEAGGPGRFVLNHDRFLMFPAWEHERLDWIKPEWLPPGIDLAVDEPEKSEPTQITFNCYAEAARIWQVPSREAFDQLDDLHPWARPQIDMRFNYKPERPLYLLALRAYRMSPAVVVPNLDVFAGCVSWVPLGDSGALDASASSPAMAEDEFHSVLSRVERAFAS
ncbi:MAG: DUF1802 family protein [Phycisphaeraceae bacterium]|nr:DUF1802 family protein [Phycisphaeraceae bacterium]